MIWIFLSLTLFGFILIWIGHIRYEQGHKMEGTIEILIGVFQFFGMFAAFL